MEFMKWKQQREEQQAQEAMNAARAEQAQASLEQYRKDMLAQKDRSINVSEQRLSRQDKMIEENNKLFSQYMGNPDGASQNSPMAQSQGQLPPPGMLDIAAKALPGPIGAALSTVDMLNRMKKLPPPNNGLPPPGSVNKPKLEITGFTQTALGPRPTYGVSKEDQANISLNKQAMSDLQKQVPEVNDLFTAFEAMENSAVSLGDFKSGPEQIISQTEMKAKEMMKDPTVTKYVGTLNQQLAKIARKQNDEKGALSDFDVDRVLKGLGSATAPLSVKIDLLKEMRFAARQKILSRLEASGMTLDDLKNKYPKFYNKMMQEPVIQKNKKTGELRIIYKGLNNGEE
jgi:hypothetical protein